MLCFLTHLRCDKSDIITKSIDMSEANSVLHFMIKPSQYWPNLKSIWQFIESNFIKAKLRLESPQLRPYAAFRTGHIVTYGYFENTYYLRSNRLP